MPFMVEYNNIVIYDVTITEFHQELVYDQGHNHLYSRFRIGVEGYISGIPQGRPRTFDNQHPDKSLPQLWSSVRKGLMEPRRPFVFFLRMWQAGQAIDIPLLMVLPAKARDESSDPETPEQNILRDLENGPRPTSFAVVSFMGLQAVRVRWAVECARLEPPFEDEEHLFDNWELKQDDIPQIGEVLSNTWSTEELFDENAACTRSITGTLRLSRHISLAKFDGRWLCVPPLEDGFRRTSMRYAVSENGLEVTYQVVDRQVAETPPWPCTSMRVRHERWTNIAQATTNVRVDVELAGPPVVPKRALVIRAFQIIDFFTHVLSAQGDYGKKFIIESAQIAEEFGDRNTVSASMTVQTLAGEASDRDMNWVTQHFLSLGTDLVYEGPVPEVEGLETPEGANNPKRAWTFWPYGYTVTIDPNTGREATVPRDASLMVLFAAYLQRPYRGPHRMSAYLVPDSLPDGERPRWQAVRIQAVPKEEIQPFLRRDVKWGQVPEYTEWDYYHASRYSESHKVSPYTFYRVRNRYRCINGRVPVLVAKRPYDDPDRPPVKIIVFHEPYAYREMIVDAERIGQLPELPAPNDYYPDPQSGESQNAPRAWLLRMSIEPMAPEVAPTGDALIYRARARYLWIVDKFSLDQPFFTGLRGHTQPLPQDQYAGFNSSVFTSRLGPTNEVGEA